MHRMVGQVFKTLMFAIIFVFIWDIGFYIFRSFVLNARMESLMMSMQKVVMENNYLPEGNKLLYDKLFEQVASDFNGDGSAEDIFIVGDITLNYGANATNLGINNLTVSGRGDVLKKNMSVPASYGDVMVVQASAKVAVPFWSWGAGNTTTSLEYVYSGEDATRFTKKLGVTQVRQWTYLVPCLKYQGIHNLSGN